LNLDAKCSEWLGPRSGRFTPNKREPVHILHESELGPVSVCTGTGTFMSTELKFVAARHNENMA